MTPQLHVLLAAYDEAEVLTEGPPSEEEIALREMRTLLDSRPRLSPDVSVLNALFMAVDTRPEEPGLRVERPPVRPRRSWRVAKRSVGVLAACAALVWVSTAGWNVTHPAETTAQQAVEEVGFAPEKQVTTAVVHEDQHVQTVRQKVVPAQLPNVDHTLAWEQDAQREELAQARVRAQHIEARLDSLLWGEPVRTLSIEAAGDMHHALVPVRAGTP